MFGVMFVRVLLIKYPEQNRTFEPLPPEHEPNTNRTYEPLG
jgi:hypothetical protein